MENSNEELNTENGDVHDGDSGDYLFTLDPETGLPASFQIFYNGYWYVFKMDGRQKEESTEPLEPLEQDIPITDADINRIDPLKDL